MLNSQNKHDEYLDGLRFPSDLEKAYQEEHIAKTLLIHRIMIWTAVIAFVLFHIFDQGMADDVVRRLTVIRFGIFIPLLLAMLAWSYHPFYKKIFNWMSSLSVILAGLCVIIVQLVVDPTVFAIFNTSLLLIIFSGYTLARLRFVFAVWTGWFLFSVYTFVAIFYAHNDPLTVAMSCAFVVFANVIGMISAYYTKQFVRRDFVQRLMLDEARERSDTLLYNILPISVADRLKRGELVADSFSDASILFADIVDFTLWSSNRKPQEVLTALNIIFSRFDALVDEYDLEKVKTVGDAYMVVSGVPTPRKDNVRVIAEMALSMQKVCAELRSQGDLPFSIRVGIHCGPVVAGVIGNKKIIYDLWGDTVNVASRMESTGASDRIQASDLIYEKIRNEYEFEKRGSIPVKGRGEMVTYWLNDRKENQNSIITGTK